jgi:hypothetical protein
VLLKKAKFASRKTAKIYVQKAGSKHRGKTVLRLGRYLYWPHDGS